MDKWNVIIGAVSAIVAAAVTGTVAWYKAGPERRGITTDYQAKILANLNEAYDNLSDENSQLKMKNMALEQQIEDCQKQIHRANMIADKTELVRSRAHLAGRTLLAYELHLDIVLDELRKHQIPITPMMQTHNLREAYQTELSKLEKMEAGITERAVRELSGDDTIT